MNDKESKGGAIDLPTELLQTQEGSCVGDRASVRLSIGNRLFEDGGFDLTNFRKKMHRLILEKIQNTPIGVDPQLFEGEPCTTK